MFFRVGSRLSLTHVLVMLSLLVPAVLAGAAEREDHALIKRFAGSDVVKRSVGKLESYWIPMGRLFGDGQAEKFEVVEGTWTHLTYSNPPKSSVTSIGRHYDQQLRDAGFEIVYECRDGECGNGWHKTTGEAWDATVARRYLVGRKARPEGDLWACINVREKSGKAPAQHDVDVVEVKPAPRAPAIVRDETDPAWIEHELNERGVAVLYGIEFDAKKLNVRSSSAAVLEAITALFTRDPARRLLIVVHTDELEDWKASVQRSRKQASSLVSVLVSTFRVPSARVAADGAGPLAPRTPAAGAPAGASSRRVEIISLRPLDSKLRATNN